MIINYLTNPASIMIRPNIELIREYKTKYPYVQSMHLLMAMAINQTESIFSNEYVSDAAVYAGDRGKLRIYFMKGVMENTEKVDSEKGDQASTPEMIKPRTPKKSDELIDKFIKNKPSIQRPKSEFFDPAERASRSIEESDEFATETLAKIYTMQQHYQKALKIYQKLSLLYPEKSDYFALLIEHLKDKINE